jgi:hypothetical protein
MADKQLAPISPGRLPKAQGSPLDVEKLPGFLRTGPGLGIAGGLTGAALGRYIVAPLMRALGFDKGKSKRTLTILGALAGALPGAAVSLSMHRIGRGWTAPLNAPPKNDLTKMRDALLTLEQNRPYADQPEMVQMPFYMKAKSSSYNPLGVLRAQDQRWKPEFGVSSALNTISTNAIAPPRDKVRQMQLVSQAGKEQDGVPGGMASPAALMQALPRVASNAIPTVGGAWLASKLLGAPGWINKGAIGSALVYSALKSFMK